MLKNKLMTIAFLCIIMSFMLINFARNNPYNVIKTSIQQMKEKSDGNINDDLKLCTKNIESNYINGIAGTRRIVKITNLLDYKIFHKIYASEVILGKEGWLFYDSKDGNDGDTVADYMGTNKYSKDQIETIEYNIKQLQNKLQKKGIKLYIMIPPNKDQIYSEYMPSDIKVVNKEGKSDELIKQLKTDNFNIISVKDELLENKNKVQEYYKNDTHWNRIGAQIAAQKINNVILNKDEEFNKNNVLVNGKTKKYDLLNILNLSEYNDDNEYEYVHKEDSEEPKYEAQDENKIDDYTSNSDNKKNILFAGDSFRLALEYTLPRYYSKIDFVHRRDFNDEVVDKMKPDIVIYEVVERQTDALLKPISD
ncbi:hypothetical protein [Clostridium sp. BJN0001]|uniref:alginate O-acetyltransferase AlgX-related protein n=1 Tax=Clostridium sp. BJN0001 TaxID=2930219 RepID=UPI001FD15B72|nr:hypothetical protein [Clostridium sp. BJN0001]